MTITHLKISNLVIAIAAVLMLLAGVAQVSAQSTTPVLVLTINGGSVASIVDGESVDIAWYLDGPVTNCVLTRNGTVIQNIDTSTPLLPVSGNLTETPPTGASTSYGLNCTGLVDTVSTQTNPNVWIDIQGGNNQQTDSATGVINSVTVEWGSDYATVCSDVWMEQSGPTQTYYVSDGGDYTNKNQTYGEVRFDGTPHPKIDRTTTFYITCTNSTTGESTTDSVTLNVSNPAAPEPLVINLWTDTPVATTDPLYGYAQAVLGFNSIGAERCYYAAYYVDGTQYPNPSGWGAWLGHTSRGFNNVRIATTTDFEVRCERSEFNLLGTIYPAVSVSEFVRVVVDQGIVNQDRTLLPPVTASLTATPNPAYKDAITGRAAVVVDTAVANADYCYQYAYTLNSVSGLYEDYVYIDGWTREGSSRRGNGDKTYVAYITEPTRFELDCQREYDVIFGTTAELEVGTELVSEVVLTEEPLAPAPAPITYIYGNSLTMNHDDVLDEAISNTGFSHGSGDFIQTASPSTGNSITFPFEHPFGASDTYNIHVLFFDENDGVSTFRMYAGGAGLVGTWTTDNPQALSDLANNNTQVTKLVASGVSLDDGDLITIECDTPDDGEHCRFDMVYFGAGNGGSVQVPAAPPGGGIDVPIMWLSENTTKCYDANATNLDETYQWTSSSKVGDERNEWISTSTTFSISCKRLTDGLSDTSSVQVIMPGVANLGVIAAVDSGECVDPNTLLTISAPDGFIADADPTSPTYRQCIPSVDLAAINPSYSTTSVNAVNGTYNLSALQVIRNLGPGDLAAGSEISYLARLIHMPVLALLDKDTGEDSFNGAINNGQESPTLTQTLTNIPFGTHELCSDVNLDAPNDYPEASTNLANNTNCTTITLPVPYPPMSINSDREVIRSGQTADIDWAVNVTYRLNCTVSGAGGLSAVPGFDTISEGPGYTDSYTTNPLTSTSEFVFQCTEPITNTTFTENVVVEVIPDYEEI